MDDAAYVNQRDRESSYRGEGGANVLAQIQRGQWEWGGGTRVVVTDEQRNFAASASDCAEVESGSVCPLQHA